MGYIYSQEWGADPFIVSSVGNDQNYIVLSRQNMIKDFDAFFKAVYGEVDGVNLQHPFLRIIDYSSKLLLMHYWPTLRSEPFSGRKGLFIVSGLVVERKLFFQNPIYVLFAIQELLQSVFDASETDPSNPYSDLLWDLLQNDATGVGNRIYEQFTEKFALRQQLTCKTESTSLNRVAKRKLQNLYSHVSSFKREKDITLSVECDALSVYLAGFIAISCSLHRPWLLPWWIGKVNLATHDGISPNTISYISWDTRWPNEITSAYAIYIGGIRVWLLLQSPRLRLINKS